MDVREVILEMLVTTLGVDPGRIDETAFTAFTARQDGEIMMEVFVVSSQDWADTWKHPPQDDSLYEIR